MSLVLIIVAVIVVVIIAVTVFAEQILQKFILFHPPNRTPIQYTGYSFDVDKKRTVFAWKTFGKRLTKDAPVLVYYHGNACSIPQLEPFLGALAIKLGCSVVAPEYPGYYEQSSLFSTAAEFFDYHDKLFASVLNGRNDCIIVGQSLGSSVATWIASRYGCKQLSLICPFSSITDTMAYHVPLLKYIPRGLIFKSMPHAYDNTYWLSTLPEHTVVTIDHGEKDTVIPYQQSETLKQTAEQANLHVSVQYHPYCDHNNLNVLQILEDRCS